MSFLKTQCINALISFFFKINEFKKHGTLPTNTPIHIYTNRINNRLVFKIKNGYKLEL